MIMSIFQKKIKKILIIKIFSLICLEKKFTVAKEFAEISSNL